MDRWARLWAQLPLRRMWQPCRFSKVGNLSSKPPPLQTCAYFPHFILSRIAELGFGHGFRWMRQPCWHFKEGNLSSEIPSFQTWLYFIPPWIAELSFGPSPSMDETAQLRWAIFLPRCAPFNIPPFFLPNGMALVFYGPPRWEFLYSFQLYRMAVALGALEGLGQSTSSMHILLKREYCIRHAAFLLLELPFLFSICKRTQIYKFRIFTPFPCFWSSKKF